MIIIQYRDRVNRNLIYQNNLPLMKITRQDLPKSQVELIIEISLDELSPYIEQAVNEISTQKPIAGFRPGKVPVEIAKQHIGEMTILQHASNQIIADTYYKALEQEKIETVDQPRIDVIKLAPNNPFIYKATASLSPKVTLADIKTLKVKNLDKIEVKDDEVQKVLEDLRNMRATEAAVDRPAKESDKVEVDFETFVDKIAIPGGKAEKYPLIIGSEKMIPGFEAQVIGLKKGEEKEFELTFPKKYHNENIAGKKAHFKVKVNEVYERSIPEINDDLAKSLGLKSADDLKLSIKHNLEHEQEHQARHKKDVEMVNLLLDKTGFGDIPDTLISDETYKMVEELKDNIAQQGLRFEDYLEHLKKQESDLRLDFAADALKRVKTALAIRTIAKQEHIEATDKEIDQERDLTLNSYKLNPAFATQMDHLEKNINSEGARRYFANVIVNRKVMDLLRKTMIDGYEDHSCDHEHDEDHDEPETK